MIPYAPTELGRRSWRSLLSQHGNTFLQWLESSKRGRFALDTVASQLSRFLISEVERATFEVPEAPVLLWESIPKVRACCADLRTFEQPFAVEAYAYVHFLERYRRTWKTLEHLASLAVLPLGAYGVRVLDIGAGPAHSSYAVHDFYVALREWAEGAAVPELVLPPPELTCIEQSSGMVRFFHHFSEFSGRQGPFHTLVADFQSLSLQALRDWHQRQSESQDYWDDETDQIETYYDTVSAAHEAQRLYRFRLVVMSNFLTLVEEVNRFEPELHALFSDLRAGGVALILGGTGDSYQPIYERLAKIAKRAGMTEGDWHADDLGESMQDHEAASVVKAAQHAVFVELERMAVGRQLQRERAWPDYWSPVPSAQARSKFALRAFRIGRWPR